MKSITWPWIIIFSLKLPYNIPKLKFYDKIEDNFQNKTPCLQLWTPALLAPIFLRMLIRNLSIQMIFFPLRLSEPTAPLPFRVRQWIRWNTTVAVIHSIRIVRSAMTIGPLLIQLLIYKSIIISTGRLRQALPSRRLRSNLIFSHFFPSLWIGKTFIRIRIQSLINLWLSAGLNF